MLAINMPLASMTVRIDAALKRHLKARLAEEGMTIAQWVTETAHALLATPLPEDKTRMTPDAPEGTPGARKV